MTSETDEDKVAVDSDVESDYRKSRGDRRSKKPTTKFINKVIIRRLPPTMTEETFLQQIEPMPSNDHFNFVPADWSLGQFATSRAYIHFTDPADVFLFKDKFDGYVFVDAKGVEYPAIVEFAPMQQLPKSKAHRVDSKAGTIEEDAGYISFIESLSSVDADASKPEMKMEYSYQIKDVKMITTTPLLEFLATKQGERGARNEERRRKYEGKKDKNRKKDLGQTQQDTGDRKRRDGAGRSRNRPNAARSAQAGNAAVPADGLPCVMRTIKSNNFDRVRADDRSSRKSSDDTGNNGGKHKKHKEVSNREDNGPHQHGNGPRDGNSRKTHRNPFRTDRGATDETSKPGPDVVILRASSTPAAAQSVSFADTTAEDTAKRPMDSRRDRRAARKEARHARFEAIRTAQRRGEGDADVKIVADRGNGKAPVALSTSGVSNSTPEEQRKSANVTAAARRASHDSSSGGEHSRDHSKAKRDQRIRNKDRPTLQIYQPGRRARGADTSDRTDGPADGVVVSSGTANERTERHKHPSRRTRGVDTSERTDGPDGEKFAPPGYSARQKPSVVVSEKETGGDTVSPPIGVATGRPSEKRVSRYSERRNKQRREKADAETAHNDAGAGGVALLVRDLHATSLKEAL